MKIKSLLNLIAVLVVAQLMFACNSSKKYYDFGAHQTAYKQTKHTPAPEAEEKENLTLSQVALSAADEKAAQAEAEPVLEASVAVAPAVAPKKAPKAAATTTTAAASEETKTVTEAEMMALAKERISSMTKAEKKEMKKEMKNAIKQSRGGVNVIEVILAIFLPPLAVFLHDGIGTSFWINIILTILGFLPGVIHALLVVTDTI